MVGFIEAHQVLVGFGSFRPHWFFIERVGISRAVSFTTLLLASRSPPLWKVTGPLHHAPAGVRLSYACFFERVEISEL